MRLLARLCLVPTILLSLAAGAVQAAPAQSAPGDFEASTCPDGGQPLNQAGFVRIGGIEQWVTLRGDDCANPVILFLHGGPGNPLSPYAETLYAAWEKDFTLVQWDQRGAGRTFGANPEPDALTVAAMTADGVELAAWLADRLHQDKVILVGGSWGSVLGVHMAKARPDLFHAYLGVGQLVSYGQNQTASYQRTVALATEAGDAATVDALEALGPPPWTNPRNFGALRRATRVYEARSTVPAPDGWWKPAPAYATDAALAEYEAGEEFSYLQFVGRAGDGMLSTVDLPALGADFDVPVYLVQGAEDLVTVPDVAAVWFATITAPRKEFRLVPAAGHDPNAALIAAQHDILQTRIRPLIR